MDEQQEVHAAGVDTGEDGGLAVATNGVHVATEHGLGQDEVVDEDQHTDDHQHNRGTTLISVTGGSQQVGDEGDDDRGKHNFEDGQAHRLGHQADLGHTGALAQLAPGKADDAQDAEYNGQTIERTPPAKDVGQVVTGNATEFEGGNRHGFADDHGGETTEDQHAGQSGNEARDADDGDPEALPDADDQADDQSDDDGEHPVDSGAFHQQCTHTTDEGYQGTNRKVDVGGDDDHHHTNGQDDHVSVLLNQGHEGVRLQQHASGQDLEGHDDDQQCADNTVLTGIVGNRGQQAGLFFFLCRCCSCGAHQAATSLSLVIPFIRYSWVNPFFSTLSVTTP